MANAVGRAVDMLTLAHELIEKQEQPAELIETITSIVEAAKAESSAEGKRAAILNYLSKDDDGGWHRLRVLRNLRCGGVMRRTKTMPTNKPKAPALIKKGDAGWDGEVFCDFCENFVAGYASAFARLTYPNGQTRIICSYCLPNIDQRAALWDELRGLVASGRLILPDLKDLDDG